MTQAYSDPSRETEQHALPDVEVFYVTAGDLVETGELTATLPPEPVYCDPGWYWWSCFPGCIPDSEPYGPFETEQEALDDAQDC